MPSIQELDSFYNSGYYDVKGYSKEYSDDEIIQKKITAYEINHICKNSTKKKVLDIGCGEGFVIAELDKMGWDVYGLDFSHDGVKRHFPHLVERVIKGDIYHSLNRLIEAEEKFDFIICNNVLEHVTAPLEFLEKFKKVCKKDTVVRIQVPNDFSWYQLSLKEKDLIKTDYWIAPPGHLSYFSQDSLTSTLESFGYKIFDLLGDFPIEVFLSNKHSNYNVFPETGPEAHKARIHIEVNLFKQSIEKFVAFRRGCGSSSVCRNLIAYCSLEG